jgi:hypothetical protein
MAFNLTAFSFKWDFELELVARFLLVPSSLQRRLFIRLSSDHTSSKLTSEPGVKL